MLLKELAKFVGLPDKKGKQSPEEIIKRLEERVGVGKGAPVRDVRQQQLEASRAKNGKSEPSNGGPGGLLGYAGSPSRARGRAGR